MDKKAHITAVSLSKETEKKLNTLQTRLGKNRSQLIRDLITSYSKPDFNVPHPLSGPSAVPDFNDPNVVLKHYYQLISTSPAKPTMVIGIAILNKRKSVLIGLRKLKDQYVKNLSWTFPSGKFSTLSFESEMIRTVAAETGFQTRVLQLIHARLIPDSPDKKIRIVALYYHCRIISGKSRPGGDFKELKWVPAADVTRFFTTSTSDQVMDFLGRL